MTKQFKMYLISHSHTDIGYTDRQEKIMRYHTDFIRQVVEINRKIEDGTHLEWEGFKWTCENYWQVETFLKTANGRDIEDFHRFVKEGKIDVSLNYLNMTELVDNDVLRKKLQEGANWAKAVGFEGNSAMTADVNGYAWNYSSALLDSGIEHLFSCVHGHHGLAPLRFQQKPFIWKTPDNRELFVWNGGHYMLGNEFLLIPNTRFTYHLKDEFQFDEVTDQFKVTENRIFNYVRSLRKYGYQYNYVPVMISGILNDNAPANGQLMNSINHWNSLHGEEIELEIVTLNEFFKVASQEENIPIYEGDWNDWWADGVGSTPGATKIYKDAQRKYHLINKLDPNDKLGLPAEKKKAEDNLMMYAEHTWGYSSSVSEPWNTLVNDLEYRKTDYATQAHISTSVNLDEILAKKGEVSISPDREKIYKVINPHEKEVTDVATVLVEHWEHINGIYIDDINIHRLVAIDESTGQRYPTQALKTARATEVKVWVTLAAKEEKTIKVIIDEIQSQPYNLSLIEGSESVQDILEKDMKYIVNVNRIENDYFTLTFDNDQGISSLILKETKQSLLANDRKHAPFAGIYDVTPVRNNPVEERRLMGRNRKGKFAKQYQSKLKDIRILADGDIFTSLLLEYELEGTKIYSVNLKVYKLSARLDATVRVHKESIWEPENVYVSLPFTLPNSECFIDKVGGLMRPGIDQIPGTNMEFYLTQNGLIRQAANGTLIILSKDAPLMTFGELKAHEIVLSDETTSWKNEEVAYSWIMNNYWETNFKAETGGFYEFNYSLFYQDNLSGNDEIVIDMENKSEGIIGISI